MERGLGEKIMERGFMEKDISQRDFVAVKNKLSSSKSWLLLFLIPVLVLFALIMFSVVPAGNIGVYNNLGVVSENGLQPGFYFKLPWVSIIPMSIQTQELKESSTVPSMEGLLVTLETSLIYKVEPNKVPEVYKTLGVGYSDVIIAPQLRSVIREISSKYEAKALYTSARSEITEKIFEDLQPRLASRGIIVESILLRDLKLPEIVTTAIENKLKADQEAQQMSFVLQKETQEAERKRIEAAGIKDSQKIIAESLTDAYLHWYWLQHLNEATNVIYVATEAGMPIFKEVGK